MLLRENLGNGAITEQKIQHTHTHLLGSFCFLYFVAFQPPHQWRAVMYHLGAPTTKKNNKGRRTIQKTIHASWVRAGNLNCICFQI